MVLEERRLEHVAYSDSEGAIFATIGGKENRFAFSPFVYYPAAGLTLREIGEFAECSGISPESFSISGASLRLSFANFSSLKKSVAALSQMSGFRPSIIEPERQFLLSREWSYFDTFSDANSAVHGQMRISGDAGQKELVSNMLRIPVEEFTGRQRFLETFAQNLFFGSGLPLGSEKEIVNFSRKGREGLNRLDFGAIISCIASEPNNFSLSGNCECCRPSSLDSANVLPSSTVRVKFLRDGIYFDSVSPSWALDFHEKNAGRGSRERMRREYSLPQYPSGPFFRNSEGEVLFADALALVFRGCAEILSTFSLEWRCTKRKSYFAQEIAKLSAMASLDLPASSGAATAQGENIMAIMDLDGQYRHVSELANYTLANLPILLSLRGSKHFLEKQSYCIEAFGSAISQDLHSAISSSGALGVRRQGNGLVWKDVPNSSFSLGKIRDMYKLNSGLLKMPING